MKKWFINIKILFWILIWLVIWLTYTWYQYFYDIKNKEKQRKELINQILISKNNKERNKEKKINNWKNLLVFSWENKNKINWKNNETNKKFLNTWNYILKENKKIDILTWNILNSTWDDILREKEKEIKKEIYLENKNKVIFSWNVCYFWKVNFKFKLFLNLFDYHNMRLLKYIKYKKEFKPFLTNLYVKYICFKNIKLSNENIDSIINMYNYLKKNKKNNFEDVFYKFLSNALKVKSDSIFKWIITKDIELWTLKSINWCVFKNFDKLLLLNWIILESTDNISNYQNTDCYINDKFNLISLTKNVDIKYFYKNYFKNYSIYVKNRKKVSVFKNKSYKDWIIEFSNYLIFKKKYDFTKEFKKELLKKFKKKEENEKYLKFNNLMLNYVNNVFKNYNIF